VRSLRDASFAAAPKAARVPRDLALGYRPLQAGLALLPLDAVAFLVPLARA
jgi:hypothetical protein